MGKRQHEQAELNEDHSEEVKDESEDPLDTADGSDESDLDSEGEEASSGSSSDGVEGSSSGPEVSSDPDESDGDDPDAFDKIDVNFEFFDPKEADFHGLKALLHSYLDGQQYDNSSLIDTIIKQAEVGTVVRTGEDEDPIAVMTVLNTLQHSSTPFMQQIQDHMLSKCKDADTKRQLSQAWEQPGTGLIINERLINCPPQLAPPLVQALFSEVSWATEDQPTQELRDMFKFKRYLLMTRVFSDPLPQDHPQQQQQQQGRPPGSSSGGSAGKGKPPAGPGKPPKGPQQQPAKKQKHQDAAEGGPVIVYVRPEDEFFHKHATAAFTFPVEGRAVGKDELQPLRLVLLLPANKVAAARSALDEVVGNMAAHP